MDGEEWSPHDRTTEGLAQAGLKEDKISAVPHGLSTDSDVVKRELISNASDALDKIMFLSLTDREILGEGDKTKLEIQVSIVDNTVSWCLCNPWNITEVAASIGYALDMLVDARKNDISLISSMSQLIRHKNGLQRSFTSSRKWTHHCHYFIFVENLLPRDKEIPWLRLQYDQLAAPHYAQHPAQAQSQAKVELEAQGRVGADAENADTEPQPLGMPILLFPYRHSGTLSSSTLWRR
ncbi:hypothetical protein P8452_57428 [Trifolium repens]|nr:hypothetical protein P8452_57428 [Trifolium repens]